MRCRTSPLPITAEDVVYTIEQSRAARIRAREACLHARELLKRIEDRAKEHRAAAQPAKKATA